MTDRAVDILRVDGREWPVGPLDGDRRLADVLRDELELTGVKVACGSGSCGACVVLVDGRPTLSCLALAAAAVGHDVQTIHGLSDGDPVAAAVQEAFVEADAMQCGFCTPGQVVTATALLRHSPSADREEIVRAMAGNICRCGAYAKIVRAVESAGELVRADRPAAV